MEHSFPAQKQHFYLLGRQAERTVSCIEDLLRIHPQNQDVFDSEWVERLNQQYLSIIELAGQQEVTDYSAFIQELNRLQTELVKIYEFLVFCVDQEAKAVLPLACKEKCSSSSSGACQISQELDTLKSELLDALDEGDHVSVIQALNSIDCLDTLEKLLNEPIEIDDSLLMLACEWGDEELVAFLLGHPIMQARGVNLKNEEGDNAFTLACKEENLGVLSLLLASEHIDLHSLNYQLFQGQPFLHYLVQREVIKTLEFFVDKAIFNFDVQDVTGKTPFFVACEENLVSIVELFLKLKGSLQLNLSDSTGLSPLHASVINASHESLKLLLNDQEIEKNPLDHLGQTPFWRACKIGEPKIIELMLQYPQVCIEKANIYGVNPIKLLVWNEQEAILEVLRPETKNKIQQAKQASEKFFSPREELCYWVRKNTHLKLIQDCLQKDFASVSKLLSQPIEKSVLNALDENKNSLLHYLIWAQHLELLKSMINHSNFLPALINTENNEGKSPFYLACEQGNLEIIDTLIFSGHLNKQSVNKISCTGETPLTLLCKKQDEACLDSLLQLPIIDLNQVNAFGEKPYELAKSLGLSGLIALIESKRDF